MQSDRVIGELLQRIPGIEVTKSGGITYQGTPISAFYIEGLNLLDNKYGIATNNIPIDAVSSVDVIENHQPVNTLKDEIISTQAAVNIRLKEGKKVRPVGTVQAGGGYGFDDLLWLLNAFTLKVGNTGQSLVMYKTNNTGYNIGAELSDQALSAPDESSFIMQTPASLLNATASGLPAVEENRYLFNKSHSATFNNLRKINNTKQIRTNVNYLNDYNDEKIDKSTSYFLGDSALVMNEYYFNEYKSNIVDGALTYTDSSAGHFLEESLKAKFNFSDTYNDITNRHPISQNFDIKDFTLKNTFRYTKKIGARILNYRSFSNFYSSPHNLTVDQTGGVYNQNIQRKGFDTYNDAYWVNNFKKVSFQVKGVLEASMASIESVLDHFKSDSVNNNLFENYLKITVEPQLSYTIGDAKIASKLPVIMYLKSDYDRLSKKSEKPGYFFFNPYLNFNWAFSSATNASLSAQYNNNIGSITDYADSYILTDYRHLMSFSGIPLQSSSFRISLNMKHRNAMKGFYYNANGFFTRKKNNRSSSMQLIDGMIFSSYRPDDNYSNVWSAMGSIAKNFYDQKISFSLSAQYLLLQTEKIQQEKLYGMDNESLLIVPKINYIFRKFATITYEAKITNNMLKITKSANEKTENSTLNYSQKLNFNIFPDSHSELKIRAERAYNEISANAGVNSNFIDLSFLYKFKKTDFSLSWNNILNQKEYSYIIYNELDTYRYNYRLRPQNIIASVTFRY